MVNDPAVKAERYRAQRAALASQRGVRFVHLPDGQPAPADAFAVKRISFIRHGQGEHNLHQELWQATDRPGNPYGPERIHELPHLVDPRLTAKGVVDAQELQAVAPALTPTPELIVVSP